jgi:hypothetical protein
MLRALADFAERMQRGGVGLFYYSGHAVQVSGLNHLVPIDAELPTDKYVASDTVDLRHVLNRMDGAENQLNIVILDACRNNLTALLHTEVLQGDPGSSTDVPEAVLGQPVVVLEVGQIDVGVAADEIADPRLASWSDDAGRRPETEPILLSDLDYLSQGGRLREPGSHPTAIATLRSSGDSNLGWTDLDVPPAQLERHRRRSEGNLGPFEHTPVLLGGRRHTGEGLFTALQTRCDVPCDDSLKLVPEVWQRPRLSGDVVFQTLRGQPLAFLEYDRPNGHSTSRHDDRE